MPTIGGMKVAYGAGPMLDFVALFPDDVAVFTGNADIFGLVPFGVAGMINPPTSFMPELCVALWRALERGDYAAAVGLQSRVNALARTVIANIARHGRGTVAETFGCAASRSSASRDGTPGRCRRRRARPSAAISRPAVSWTER